MAQSLAQNNTSTIWYGLHFQTRQGVRISKSQNYFGNHSQKHQSHLWGGGGRNTSCFRNKWAALEIRPLFHRGTTNTMSKLEVNSDSSRNCCLLKLVEVQSFVIYFDKLDLRLRRTIAPQVAYAERFVQSCFQKAKKTNKQTTTTNTFPTRVWKMVLLFKILFANSIWGTFWKL